jgi:hypothetical protein
MAEGFTAFKMKVGMGVEDDSRRAALMRELIGWDSLLMMDANSVRACVPACLRACVPACGRAFVCACVCSCACVLRARLCMPLGYVRSIELLST